MTYLLVCLVLRVYTIVYKIVCSADYLEWYMSEVVAVNHKLHVIYVCMQCKTTTCSLYYFNIKKFVEVVYSLYCHWMPAQNCTVVIRPFICKMLHWTTIPHEHNQEKYCASETTSWEKSHIMWYTFFKLNRNQTEDITE